MTTDELRAKFEAWCLHRGVNTEKRSNGYYFSDEVCFWWKLWSAAYASRDAEVESLRKNAERYRWLRKNHNADLLAEDIIDEAIDAAMQEDRK